MVKLEACPNCNKSISTEASVCPKCGQPLTAELWAAARKKRQRGAKGCLFAGAALVGMVLLVGIFYQPQPSSEVSPLEKMSAVFVGQPSEAEIEASMISVAQSLSQAPSDNLYNTWGSILVRLRQSSGVAELETLRCIETMNGPAATVKVPFPDAAALCVTMLQ